MALGVSLAEAGIRERANEVSCLLEGDFAIVAGPGDRGRTQNLIARSCSGRKTGQPQPWRTSVTSSGSDATVEGGIPAQATRPAGTQPSHHWAVWMIDRYRPAVYNQKVLTRRGEGSTLKNTRIHVSGDPPSQPGFATNRAEGKTPCSSH